MGTGTTDILEWCNKAGLRTPEFIQDEDFLTILWRPESAHEKEQVREQVREHEREYVPYQVKRLILAIRGDTKTREEILSILRLKGRRNFIENYTAPAIADGYVAMLYPDNPK